VDGVVGIILFGSFARGEANEGSDIDLLIVFENEEKMRENEWEVTHRVPSHIFAQSICVCPSTIKRMNPVFIQSVLREGIILYLRYPWVLPSHLTNTVESFLVTYSLKELPQQAKQKVNYKLFGKAIGEHKYPGLIEECGGRRLGRGCFLVPKENAKTVLNFLTEHNIKYEVSEVYAIDKTKQTFGSFLLRTNDDSG
jgi:hypothetical protein